MSSQSPQSLPASRSFLASNGWLATCASDFVTALLAAGQLRHLRQGASTQHAGDAEGGRRAAKRFRERSLAVLSDALQLAVRRDATAGIDAQDG